MDAGVIQEELTLDELYDKSSEYIELVTTAPQRAIIILEEEFKIKDFEVKPDTSIVIYERIDQLEEIIRAMVEGGVGIKKALKEHKTLEEYYMNFTGEE